MHHDLLAPIARALALLQHPPHHPCVHTLALRRHAFFACRRDLKVLLEFRAQVGSEATGPILCGANAFPVRQIRRAEVSFMVLDVLPVCASTRACVDGAGCRRFTRYPASANGWSF